MKKLIAIVVYCLGIISSSRALHHTINSDENPGTSRIETFTFSTNGIPTKGKIFLPPSYETNKNLPAIFLIDFTEQHFKVATDEFEKVIEGVRGIRDFDALVVTLEAHLDVDAEPDTFQEHYDIFKNMAFYVGETYTSNPSRTFIGKGSESGIVMMALFLEDSASSVFENFIATDPSGLYASAIIDILEKEDFPNNQLNKKLHFSFSTSNSYSKCNRIINLINEAQFSWLEFESKYYQESDYENTYPVSFAEGIEYIFQQ